MKKRCGEVQNRCRILEELRKNRGRKGKNENVRCKIADELI